MKNRFNLRDIVSAVLLIFLVTGVAVFAASDYSSADDPLVTLSYVNDVLIPQLKSEIKAELKAELGNQTDGAASNQPAAATASVTYEVVHATIGQVILPTEPCEIILRSGSAVAVTVDAGQGLSDTTAEKELLSGEALTKNHYVIVPRGDGRGVLITSNDAYFMVRGGYTVEN